MVGREGVAPNNRPACHLTGLGTRPPRSSRTRSGARNGRRGAFDGQVPAAELTSDSQAPSPPPSPRGRGRMSLELPAPCGVPAPYLPLPPGEGGGEGVSAVEVRRPAQHRSRPETAPRHDFAAPQLNVHIPVRRRRVRGEKVRARSTCGRRCAAPGVAPLGPRRIRRRSRREDNARLTFLLPLLPRRRRQNGKARGRAAGLRCCGIDGWPTAAAPQPRPAVRPRLASR